MQVTVHRSVWSCSTPSVFIGNPSLLLYSAHSPMGNTLPCMPKKGARGAARSASKRNSRSGRNTTSEEEMLHRQALSMVLQQHQLSQRFDGSMSRRIGSTSSRRKNLSENFSNGRQVSFEWSSKLRYVRDINHRSMVVLEAFSSDR